MSDTYSIASDAGSGTAAADLFPESRIPDPHEAAQDEPAAADISEAEPQVDPQPEEAGGRDAALHAEAADLSRYQAVQIARWTAVGSVLSQGHVGVRNAVKGTKDEPGLMKTAAGKPFANYLFEMQIALIELRREIDLILAGARDQEIGAAPRIHTAPANIIIPGR